MKTNLWAYINRNLKLRKKDLIRPDHNTTSEVVAGLVNGDDIIVLSTWSDGKNSWAKLDQGWAAKVDDGETYIELS